MGQDEVCINRHPNSCPRSSCDYTANQRGFDLRDLWKKQQKPDSPTIEPSTIKETIRVGGLTIEREFRGTEAVLQYRDGTSRLLLNQLKPEAPAIFDAARLVSLGLFGEARAKVSEAIKLLEAAKLEHPLRLLEESYLIQGDAAFGKELYADAERFYSSSHRFASTVDDGLLIAAAAPVWELQKVVRVGMRTR